MNKKMKIALMALATGAIGGVVVANIEKIKQIPEALLDRVDMLFAKYGMYVSEDEECECCCGGHCDCEEERCCDLGNSNDSEEEPEVNVAPAVEMFNESEDSEEEQPNPSEAGNWGAT